ncbi:MAG: metallophosphoesterase [Comamonadaceae bacterium]|nr:MAG: metallophosphoesterase [Comamonadaceae bacterium]
MTTLLHISDTHFGTEQAPVCEALRALSRDQKPDVLIFSGDLTQRARSAEFAAARAYVDSLGIAQVLVLPGNHDIPLYNVFARMFHPYQGYAREFGTELSPVIDTPAVLVVGINTTRASRHKNGVVSGEQIEAVCATLGRARPGQLRVVVTHQPAAVFRDKDEHDRLRGADPALQAWSAAGADLVLGGHIHLPYIVDLLSGSKPVPRAMWCVQAGTALSSRVRHGTANSVNLIRWDGGWGGERSCTVERCDFDVLTGRFIPASTRELVLGVV